MFNNNALRSSFKQFRIAKNIQKKLSVLFQKDLRNLVTNNLMSVTEVKVSNDIKCITVYFSFLFDVKANEAFTILENNKTLIKKKLYQSIKNDYQTMPELVFKMDSAQANASRLEQLYNKIENGV
ncbi:MAG: 30S ribosome-binding factor RbfA [Solitalea-like symbiont of Acarus siro]